jgi:hypothetical protein
VKTRLTCNRIRRRVKITRQRRGPHSEKFRNAGGLDAVRALGARDLQTRYVPASAPTNNENLHSPSVPPPQAQGARRVAISLFTYWNTIPACQPGRSLNADAYSTPRSNGSETPRGSRCHDRVIFNITTRSTGAHSFSCLKCHSFSCLKCHLFGIAAP